MISLVGMLLTCLLTDGWNSCTRKVFHNYWHFSCIVCDTVLAYAEVLLLCISILCFNAHVSLLFLWIVLPYSEMLDDPWLHVTWPV